MKTPSFFFEKDFANYCKSSSCIFDFLCYTYKGRAEMDGNQSYPLQFSRKETEEIENDHE